MYLPENLARLKAAHTYVSEELRALGVPFLNRGAGFFIWVDLRKVSWGAGWRGTSLPLAGDRPWGSPLCPEPLPAPFQYLRKATFEEETLLWRRFLDNKVLLSFGKAFECKEPGWFRVVFSDRPQRLRLGEQPPVPAPRKGLLVPTCAAPALTALTSPSQGCRGSGRCLRATPSDRGSPSLPGQMSCSVSGQQPLPPTWTIWIWGCKTGWTCPKDLFPARLGGSRRLLKLSFILAIAVPY